MCTPDGPPGSLGLGVWIGITEGSRCEGYILSSNLWHVYPPRPHGMGGESCPLFPCTPVPCVTSCIRRKNTYVSDVELKIAAATEVVRVGNDRLGWTHWDARNPGTDSCTIKVYLATCPCVACMVDITSWVSLGAEMDI